jgi:uncharacterized membrane protein YphA (DoxX/SURF4 family)
MFDYSKLPNYLMRLGVAWAFLYPPLRAIYDPFSWLAYFPPFLRELSIPPEILLHGFGIIEIITAVWILTGKKILVPATLATVMLLAIVIFNHSDMDVLFRDLSIAAMSAALAAEAWLKQRRSVLQQPQ